MRLCARVRICACLSCETNLDAQEEQLDLVSVGSSVEEEESPLVFLEQVHLFRQRVEEFTASPLPSVVNLTLTPRAADFLQQRWASVSVGALEEAPVPNVRCCSRCGAASAAETETGGEETDGQDRQSKLGAVPLVGVLGLLLLLLGLLWAYLDDRIPLDFSLFSQSGQFVHSLSDRMITCLCGQAEAKYVAIRAALETWSSYLSAVSQKSLQRLDVLFDFLI